MNARESNTKRARTVILLFYSGVVEVDHEVQGCKKIIGGDRFILMELYSFISVGGCRSSKPGLVLGH